MTTGCRTALVVLAVTLAGVARAEPTLRYNYDYVCDRGLRIVVGHCRHDSDTPDMPPTTPEDDYCQVYYPDRPKTGGIEAMETVLRSDLIQSLQACGAFGGAKSDSKAQQGAAASAATPAAAPVAAPGIGKAHWRNLDFGDDLARFVLPANLKPGGPTGRGWFLKMYRVPHQSTDGRITQIAIAQELWTADCTHNTIASLQSSYFSAAGAPLGAYVVPSPEHINVNPGTVGEDMLKLLCARPYELDEVDYFSDAVTIRKNWSLPTSPQPSAPAPAGAPPQGSAATSSGTPSGRPAIKPMPIGPELCPLLRRLETLAHEDFRSIELGPDRAVGKDADKVHRTSMSIPGARFCQIEHYPGEPVNYTCIWPQATEKEVDDQFVNMGRALEQCTGGTLDLSTLEFGDVTVKMRGVEFVASIISDFMSLDVHMAKP